MTAEPVRTGNVIALPDVHVPLPAQARGVEPHQWNALKTTVWKGASDAMILVALDYCKARRLDPLKRPIHIVKVYDPETSKMVDSIWEGIGSHRTTASRTSEYVGQDRPVFGPQITETVNGQQFTFPEWCEVTVYRMKHGERRAYTGVVYWLEAFAQGKQGTGPNRMWRKRPRGQLAKCAEAEALRKAFPEELGDLQTAEEMDGQQIGPDNARDITPERPAPASRLDGLEELIGPSPDAVEAEPERAPGGELFDGETGEILEEPLNEARWIELHARLEQDMLTRPKEGLREWWQNNLEVGDLSRGAPELYADLLGKVKGRLPRKPA